VPEQTDILCGKKNYTVVHDEAGVRRIMCGADEIPLDTPIARRLIAMFEHRTQNKTMFRSNRSSARQPLRPTMPANDPLKPPFVIYGGTDIADQNGHVCSTDNPEITQMLLALLNRSMIPASPETPGLTPERVLDWIELSFLRVRDSETARSVSNDPLVRVLNEVCDHIAAFRKEFREHG
jgi:hypothetical protein